MDAGPVRRTRRKVLLVAILALIAIVPSLLLLSRLPTFDRACLPERFPLDYWRLDRELSHYVDRQNLPAPDRFPFLAHTEDGFPWRTGVARIVAARERAVPDPSLVREGMELLVTVERVAGFDRSWEVHDVFLYDNGQWALPGELPSSIVLERPPVPADFRLLSGPEGFCDPVLARNVAAGPAVPIAGPVSLLRLGRQVFLEYRCADCHEQGSEQSEGGSLRGLFGKTVALRDGTRVVVDDDYLRESILDPDAKVRAGASTRMPRYRGKLSDARVVGLVEYVKTLE